VSKLRVSLKFHLNRSFQVKVMNKTSLGNFFFGINCHGNKMAVMAVWTVFLKGLTSKISLLGVKIYGSM